MENYAILAHRSSLGSEVHRAPSRKGETSYIRKRSNVRNKLVIDVQPTANKSLLSPHPTSTVKTHLREILNNAENYYNAADFYTGESSKAKSRQSSVKKEDDDKKGKVVGDFEMYKQKLIKIENFRLPKISEEKARSSSIPRRPRSKNYSIDYNRSQNSQTGNTTNIDIELQQVIESQYERNNIQPQTSKAQRYNVNIVEKVEKPEKTKPQPKQDKQEPVNERQLQKKPSETNDYFNQETYRTLTSVYSSRRNLMDPFEDIRSENKDPRKTIKNVAEKHVELAHKKIDIIKKNFHRRNKTYWFNVPTQF